ncbi:hydroxymethylglutaryl-CoA lyase [Pueribacillus theae]|uniref:Hydroxymethylglutaryl-CoA lyase n=1 Tax=Pueribacillus theae TaxID=2171751 RepID=A0A2U1JSF5_9BACI|nr:hydroxymethylglutaryl-CoA lyase [Pueribacillus theae]PWA07803.1 hydroxymethylglutaryl-CoA lyase [Pueribacillus theae]
MVNLPKEVTIAEVCPRDGFQSLKETVPVDEKISFINGLMECGFKQIEVTSFVHPKAIPQLKDADEVLHRINRKNNVKLRALVPNLHGLERAIASNVDKVKLMLSASDSHSLSNANRKTMEAMAQFDSLVKRAKETTVKVSGSISVAFGCPYEGEIPVERHLAICKKYDELGIHDISLADTSGMANPVKVKRIIATLRDAYPHFNFSLHLHNTRGMAFANAVAGLKEGIVDFDSSVAGFGGCPYAPNASGNIATEDLVHGLEEMGIQTGIDLDRLIALGQELSKAYPQQADSFIQKAGKISDLHKSPTNQIKLVNE